jgi:hypothetical protein
MPGFKFDVSPNGKLVTVTNMKLEERADAVPGGSERYAVNWTEFDGLMGRMLTIVDASFPDPEQRKAVKGLVRNSIKDWVRDIAEAALADASPPA